MQTLIVSPYHGGSHRSWAEGYRTFSANDVELLTLPDRFWKWRMHGGAVTLARKFNASKLNPAVVLATDMLDLTTFVALTRHRLANCHFVLYMHENQLTYPLPANKQSGPMRRQMGERDHHYAFINFASMLTADCVVFNSSYHLESFFEALPRFLKHFPEYNEMASIKQLQSKAQVLPVGINFEQLGNAPPSNLLSLDAPLILWNQRWEYDKNPEEFFKALFALKEQGVAFKVAVCGQQYGKRPLIFKKAQTILADHLIHFGFADAATYRRLLWQADIVVSTAHHEFFGISVLEAIGCHAFPILPNRLAYPELVPLTFHPHCLYNSPQHLLELLKQVLAKLDAYQQARRELADAARQFSWQKIASEYDSLFALALNEV